MNNLIDGIVSNILRLSSVFWMLTVDCSLSLFFSLPEQYHLFIVVFEGLYTHTSMRWLQCFMKAVSRSLHATNHAPGDKVPRIPIRYHVHAMWFQSIMLLIWIRPSIAWYHVRQCVRWNLNLDILLPICDSSWNVCQQFVGSAYSELMLHPKGYLACIIDLIGDQPILCVQRTWRVSSYRICVWRCNAY